MKVSIKDLGIPMEIKSKGIEIQVGDSSSQLGDLYVTMTGLVWCRGRTTRPRGVKLTWSEFIKLMENPSKVRKLLRSL